MISRLFYTLKPRGKSYLSFSLLAVEAEVEQHSTPFNQIHSSCASGAVKVGQNVSVWFYFPAE